MDGADRFQNKTLPPKRRERNEAICEHGRRVVDVPVVVEPVHVPVPRTVVPVQIQDVAVAVRVPQDCIEHLPCHHPSNTLRVVSYSAFIMP